MPTPATASGGTATKNDAKKETVKTMAATRFIRASGEYGEPFLDTTIQLTTSDQRITIPDVPAYGYLRRIVLLVTASGGTGGSPSVTLNQDAPFNVLKNIYVKEPNGGVLHQSTSGFHLYLINKYGGYRPVIGADARALPSYTAPTTALAGFQFMLSIPLEINSRSGLGALPNQNSVAPFRLEMDLAKVADIATGTLPTTLPSVRIRGFIEAWDQPENSSGGQVNQTSPPGGFTTQFWTSQRYNIPSGEFSAKFNRMGNYIRNWICIYERTGGTRVNGQSDWPDPVRFFLDTRPQDNINKAQFVDRMAARTGYGVGVGTTAATVDTPNGLDSGVFHFSFTHDANGMLGMEENDLWFPTLTSSRVELAGNWANAGVLTVLTNDVAIGAPVFT